MGSKKDYTQPLWRNGLEGAAENNFLNATSSIGVLKLWAVPGRGEQGEGCSLLALFLTSFL